MFADTTYTMKSGAMGTSMFSRSGKVTNYQYLCFGADGSTANQSEEMGDEDSRAKDTLYKQHQIKVKNA